MASKFTVEEALRTDVDLSTVNAIVGSLETLEATSSTSVQQHIHFTSANQQIINNNSAIVSNGGPISTSSQKHHGVTNGEISSYSALNNNRVVNSLDIKTNNNNLSELITTSIPSPIGTTTVASNGNNKISAPNNNTFTSNHQIVAVNSQQYQTTTQQQHQHQQQHNQLQPNIQPTSTIMSKNNEPVKLVYPSQTGVSQPAVINMNNRVTFTSQSLPNGTINLSTLTTQQQQGIIQTSASTGMTSVGNSAGLKTTAPQQQQQPTLVIQKQVLHGCTCHNEFFFRCLPLAKKKQKNF